MDFRVGVDLGTAYIAAAVSAIDASPAMIVLGSQAFQIPSVLFLRPRGVFAVGDEAERLGAVAPARLIRGLKRRLGDDVNLLVGGSCYAAETLLAQLLSRVIDVVSQRQGSPPSGVVVTHPSSWRACKRQKLADALRVVGLGEARIVTEAGAAAVLYASRTSLADGECIAVYDLGGGAFDATVLRRQGEDFVMLGAPEGIEQFGGIDFDDAVFQYVLGQIGDRVAAGAVNTPEFDIALAHLRRDCVGLKEALSTETESIVSVVLPGLYLNVALTRDDFEREIRPMATATVETLHRALRSASIAPAELHAIVMIGGSVRIPLVQSVLSSAFECPLALDLDPQHDVALGAALAWDQAIVAGAGCGGRTWRDRVPGSDGCPAASTSRRVVGRAAHRSGCESTACLRQPAPGDRSGSAERAHRDDNPGETERGRHRGDCRGPRCAGRRDLRTSCLRRSGTAHDHSGVDTSDGDVVDN